MVLSHRSCDAYEADSVKGVEVEFLLGDPSIQCGTNDHAALKAISIVLILLW